MTTIPLESIKFYYRTSLLFSSLSAGFCSSLFFGSPRFSLAFWGRGETRTTFFFVLLSTLSRIFSGSTLPITVNLLPPMPPFTSSTPGRKEQTMRVKLSFHRNPTKLEIAKQTEPMRMESSVRRGCSVLSCTAPSNSRNHYRKRRIQITKTEKEKVSLLFLFRKKMEIPWKKGNII